MSDTDRRTLTQGLAEQGLALPEAQIERLLAYHGLLAKWNRAYNLTSVRDPADMIGRHLLDSLSVLPFIGPGDLLDVGTGPGLPGLVLALAQPERNITLLDSNGKKARFLTQVKLELEVANVEVVHDRIEAWRPARTYAVVTSRAFATLADMVAKSAHLLAADGCFLAMKGHYPHAEIAALPPGFQVDAVHPLTVPGTPGARHLVQLSARAE